MMEKKIIELIQETLDQIRTQSALVKLIELRNEWLRVTDTTLFDLSALITQYNQEIDRLIKIEEARIARLYITRDHPVEIG